MLKYALLALALTSTAAFSDPAKIVNVSTAKSGNLWSFDVTIAHGDTGWDDYANGWRITAPDGTKLGTRELAHPHVNEQPFTRSLSGVRIPAGVKEVNIQASESIGGYTSKIVTVKLR